MNELRSAPNIPLTHMSTYFEAVDWLNDHLLTCPFKSMTGIDCPGCGMQRSVIKLLEGDVAQSIAYHPAGTTTLIMIVFLILHTKFDFKHGARALTILFILNIVLITGNYIYKIGSGQLY
jgi:hypothetical protein